jgi:hypothetical protein
VNRELKVAILGLLLLFPAVVLVSTGLLGLEPPKVIVHPVFVMGGLLAAAVLNALPVLRVHLGHQEGTLVGTMSLRLRGTLLNLVALGLGCFLFATIAVYLFLENFRAR